MQRVRYLIEHSAANAGGKCQQSVFLSAVTQTIKTLIEKGTSTQSVGFTVSLACVTEGWLHYTWRKIWMRIDIKSVSREEKGVMCCATAQRDLSRHHNQLQSLLWPKKHDLDFLQKKNCELIIFFFQFFRQKIMRHFPVNCLFNNFTVLTTWMMLLIFLSISQFPSPKFWVTKTKTVMFTVPLIANTKSKHWNQPADDEVWSCFNLYHHSWCHVYCGQRNYFS